MSGMFRSLAVRNYRVWALGAIVSNVGTWMQRTAQDWIVLTQLSDGDATAMGIVTALQFAPPILLLPLTGYAADRMNQRHLLMLTQATMGVLALILGIDTIAGTVQLWHVYIFACLLGCASAFDAPARQTFVGALVDGDEIANAVALNSASFYAARMIGPAVAGILIAAIGSGWVFILNTVSFGAVIVSILMLRTNSLNPMPRAKSSSRSLLDGFRYVGARPDVISILIMVFLIGAFGLNFPLFISTMAIKVFHMGSGGYGVLSSIMAVGSVAGALIAAKQSNPSITLLVAGAGVLTLGCAGGAAAPWYWLFAVTLAVAGLSSQVFMTTANSIAQLSIEPDIRGRVMAIYLAIYIGGTPIGAPIMGAVIDAAGPRAGMTVGAGAALVATGIGLFYLVRFQGMRIRFERWRPRLHLDNQPTFRASTPPDRASHAS